MADAPLQPGQTREFECVRVSSQLASGERIERHRVERLVYGALDLRRHSRTFDHQLPGLGAQLFSRCDGKRSGPELLAKAHADRGHVLDALSALISGRFVEIDRNCDKM